MNLNSKVLLLIIPLLVLPIASIGFIAYQQLNETLLSASDSQAEKALHDISTNVQIIESSIHSNLELFSNDAIINKYVTTSEESRYSLFMPTLLRLFASYQRAYPEYYEIRIILPDGYEDARMVNRDIDNVTSDESANPIANRLMTSDGDVVSFLSINPDTQEFSYFASKALILTDKSYEGLSAVPTLRAYLSLTSSTDWLTTEINNTILGETGFVFLANRDGSVRLIPDKQSLLSVDDKLMDVVQDSVSNINIVHLLESKQHSNKAIVHLGDQKGYMWSIPVSDEFVMLAWYPKEEIESHSRKLALTIGLIAFLSIIVMSLLVYLLLNYLIIKPIQGLEVAAKTIGRGDLSKTIAISSNDEISVLAKSFNDMSANLLSSNEQIKYLAYHDNLTGLPNRLMFQEYVTQAVAFARRNEEKLAVIFLDLDDFKRINDTLGHDSGDMLLKEASDRILSCLRDTDYLAKSDGEMSNIAARFGGDEFCLFLHNVPDTFVPGKVAKRIINALSQAITINKNECYVTASIGISVYPDDAINPDDLIKYADVAMYHAKSEGKNNYQYYTETMNSAMVERISIENNLRTAINENQLFLNYQPQIDLVTGELYGVEALVRWNCPIRGLVQPSDFIPIAEESGLIIELGEWVLRRACQQAKEWHVGDGVNLKVSVNVSAVQLIKVDLAKLVSDVLSKSRLDPRFLNIEITETAIMKDMDHVSKALNAIRDLGVLISLDDFGTGYSSLNYLHRFPIDVLKIDRAFVSDILSKDSNKGAIVVAIIAMSHALGLKVVAEGVETEEQYNQLVEWDCDYIQGYYLYRPLPEEEIKKLLIKANTPA